MQEVVSESTGRRLGATFFRGTKPIDGVWCTRGVHIENACVMPVGFGVGDHRLFVVDFSTVSLLGHAPTKIVRPATRRLNSKLGQAARKYIDSLEGNIKRHRLIERAGAAHENSATDDEAERKLQALDIERKNYMMCAERKCRRIKAGRIPYSPEAVEWILKKQVFKHC